MYSCVGSVPSLVGEGLVSFLFAKVLGIVYLIVGVVTVIVSALTYAGLDWAAVVAWALPAYFGLAVFLLLPAHVLVSALACSVCVLFTVGLWKGWRPIIYFMVLLYLPSMGVALLFDLLTGIIQCIITILLFFVIISVRNKFIDEGSL